MIYERENGQGGKVDHELIVVEVGDQIHVINIIYI